MSRSLTLLFRRDPARDREKNNVRFEGYHALWPEDGRQVAVGLDAFCTHGQRLLGLGKQLAGCHEKLVKLIFLPLAGRDDELNRIPGHRVRRFYLHRQGQVGRIHFLDGTPTIASFEIGKDEARILHWCGLPALADGDIQWFDLAAVALDGVHPARSRQPALQS